MTCNRATAHGFPNPGYDYTFLRNGSPIPGHTNQSSSSYTLTSSDVGSFISCRVRASNIFGNVTSTSTNSIGPVRPPAPSNTGAPFISGTARQGETLTCNPGSWSNSPTSYQYRFLRDGVAVGSSQSYTVQAADVGQSVRCGVRASNAGGTSSEALSAPVSWRRRARARRASRAPHSRAVR